MGVSFLTRRGYRFYFRMRVPSDLVPYFQRGELKQTLHTTDPKEAKKRVKLASAATHLTFQKMRVPGLTFDELRKIAEDYLHDQLEGCEWLRSEVGWLPKTQEERDSKLRGYSDLIERCEGALSALGTVETQKRGLKIVQDLVSPVVELYDLQLSEGTIEYTFFVRELVKRLMELYRIEQQRIQGDYSNPYDRERMYGAQMRLEEKPKGPLLSAVLETYRNEHVTFEKWRPKTEQENVSIIEVLIELVGDRPITDITHNDLLTFRELVAQLPPNPKKGAAREGKSLREILEMNLKPMSQSNVRKYLTRVAAFFNWAELHKIVTTNEAKGITINKPKNQRASEERKAYAHQELQLIVNHLPCDRSMPERFWLPMISMFSGLRLDEGCQLHTEDVRDVDGIHCFHINEEGDKKVKTPSSVRIVPVHPTLIELGFLKYVERMRKEKRPRLWMNLIKKRDGYAHDYGKVFQRFNRRFITKDKKKVYHSLRHNLADDLKQNQVLETVIAELLGHEHDNITSGRYGKTYQPQVLLDALLKLSYGLDLTTLNGTPPL